MHCFISRSPFICFIWMASISASLKEKSNTSKILWTGDAHITSLDIIDFSASCTAVTCVQLEVSTGSLQPQLNISQFIPSRNTVVTRIDKRTAISRYLNTRFISVQGEVVLWTQMVNWALPAHRAQLWPLTSSSSLQPSSAQPQLFHPQPSDGFNPHQLTATAVLYRHLKQTMARTLSCC